MGIVHSAEQSHRCTFEVWHGDIDVDEVRDHLLRLAQDPDWPPGVLNLVDLTTVGAITVPDPDLVVLLREGTLLEAGLRTALVVRPDLYAGYRGDTDAYPEVVRETGVVAFCDLGDAIEHLGLEHHEVLPLMARLGASARGPDLLAGC